MSLIWTNWAQYQFWLQGISREWVWNGLIERGINFACVERVGNQYCMHEKSRKLVWNGIIEHTISFACIRRVGKQFYMHRMSREWVWNGLIERGISFACVEWVGNQFCMHGMRKLNPRSISPFQTYTLVIQHMQMWFPTRSTHAKLILRSIILFQTHYLLIPCMQDSFPTHLTHHSQKVVNVQEFPNCARFIALYMLCKLLAS